MSEVSSQAVVVMMGCREYGRHRGVSLAAVQKAIKSGRIPEGAIERDGDGGRVKRINRDLADQAWAASTDPAQQRKEAPALPILDGTVVQAPPMKALDWPEWPDWKPAETTKAKTSAGEVVDIASFQAARARHEFAEAQLAEIELAEKQGVLVRADETAQVWTGFGRIFGRACDSLETQLAPRLVGLTDVMEIRRILRAELRSMRERTANEIEKRFAAGERNAVRGVAG